MARTEPKPGAAAAADAARRLLALGPRLHGAHDAQRLCALLAREAHVLLGAPRVLVLLERPDGTQIAASRLPHGEDRAALVRAIAPWLAEARRTRATRLRHGPAGAAPAQQRSCLVAPLVAGRRCLGHLYADIDGSIGRFGAREHRLTADLATLGSVALDGLLARAWLERRASESDARAAQALEREAATADVLKVISASPTDVQPVFEAIVHSGARLFPGAAVAISQPQGDQVAMRAIAGDPGRAAAWRAVFPFPLSRDYMHGEALLDARRIDVPDVAALADRYARGAANFLNTGYRAITVVPMLRDGAAIGTVSVVRASPGPLSAAQLALLDTFADQAVIAIENARRFDETRQALERQTATAEILKVIAASPSDVKPVFDAIATSAKRLVDGFSTTVFRIVGGVLHLEAYTATTAQADDALRSMFPRPIAEFPPFALVSDGHTAHIGDTEADAGVPELLRDMARLRGFRAMLLTPLVRDGAVIGMISVTRKEPGPFDEHHAELLRTFADQAVIAIENVRLFTETRESLAQQAGLAEVLQAIGESVSDTRPVFSTILRCCERLIPSVDYVLIQVVDEQGLLQLVDHHFFSQVRGGEPGRHREREAELRARVQATFPRAMQGSALELALRARRPEVYADTLDGADVPESVREHARRWGHSYSQATVPLCVEGRVVGAIEVFRRELGGFRAKECALLQTFADQAVIAIQNAKMFRETHEALERQTATSDMLRIISQSSFDLRTVLEALVRSAANLCGADHAWIFQRYGDFFYWWASYGHATEAHDRIREYFANRPVAVDRGSVTGRVALEARVIQVTDVLADPDYTWSEAQRIGGYRSALGVPLLRDGGVGGVIFLAKTAPQPFSPRQIELAGTFADQAVIAIENVRLFNETKEALEQQTATADILRVISQSPTDATPVFDAIAERARLLCDAQVGATTRFDGESLHLVGYHGTSPQAEAVMRASFPLRPGPGSINGRCILARAPVQIADVELDPEYRLLGAAKAAAYRSLLAVPIMQAGRIIGVLGVARSAPGNFSAKVVGLLQTFADQAVIAIQNATLFNETQDALQRQTATSEILQVISGSPTDVQPVLQAVAERAAKICAAQFVDIILREGESIRGAAAFGNLSGPTEPIPLDRSTVMGRAIVERAPVHVHDLQQAQDDFPRGSELARRHGHHTTLAVPLLREGRALGAILVRRTEVQPFDDKHIALLRTFADQAAIALENVRLFNETQEALAQQTASAEILSVISHSVSDPQPVFDKILHHYCPVK